MSQWNIAVGEYRRLDTGEDSQLAGQATPGMFLVATSPIKKGITFICEILVGHPIYLHNTSITSPIHVQIYT